MVVVGGVGAACSVMKVISSLVAVSSNSYLSTHFVKDR